MECLGGMVKVRGQLDGPCGIAVDTNGMVYVAEGDNYRVSVFTSVGEFVTTFSRGQSHRGLAVDNCGVICVCDCDNNCVHML